MTGQVWVIGWNDRGYRLGSEGKDLCAQADGLVLDGVRWLPAEVFWIPLENPWLTVDDSWETLLAERKTLVWFTPNPDARIRVLMQRGYRVTRLTVPLRASGESVVLITRPWPDAWRFMEMLETEGIPAVPFPTIAFTKGDDPPVSWIRAPETFTWVVLTSPRGVEFLQRWVERRGWTRERLAHIQWACIGPATAERLRAWGFVPRLMPDHVYQAEGLVTAFGQVSVRGMRVLLVRAEGRALLRTALRDMGAEVWEWHIYRTITYPTERLRWMAAWLERTRVLTFTSPSTFHHFLKVLQTLWDDASIRKWLAERRVVAIGPVTAGAVHSAGWPVHRQAPQATQAALVQTVRDVYGESSSA